jgi:hypothetical protein
VLPELGDLDERRLDDEASRFRGLRFDEHHARRRILFCVHRAESFRLEARSAKESQNTG